LLNDELKTKGEEAAKLVDRVWLYNVEPYPLPSFAVTTQFEVVADVLAFQFNVILVYPTVDIVNSKYFVFAEAKHAEATDDEVEPPKYDTVEEAVSVGDPIEPANGSKFEFSKLNVANVTCPHPTLTLIPTNSTTIHIFPKNFPLLPEACLKIVQFFIILFIYIVYNFKLISNFATTN